MADPDDAGRRPSSGSGPGRGDGWDWLYGDTPPAGEVPDSEATQVIRGPGPPPPDDTARLDAGRPAPARRDEPPPPAYIAPTPGAGAGGSPARGHGGAPPAGPVPRPPAPARRRPRFRLRWLLWLVVAWVVFLVAVPVYAWTTVSRVDITPEGDRPNEQPGTTYLVVGSDARKALEGRRTDTIMLLHTGSGPNLLLSIPRDSMVPVPGLGTTKINAAFNAGGPRLLVRTIEAATGIRVDHYVEIGFRGFVDLVDAVGGVRICPETAMNDPQARLRVRAGCQEADGATALGYARSRKTQRLGDIDRARHQREVVSAIGAEVISWQTVVNPVRYWRTVFAGAGAVRVDEDSGPFDAARFAHAMTRVDGDAGLSCGVPIASLAVTWDEERASRLFDLIAEDRTDAVGRDLCTPSGQPAS